MSEPLVDNKKSCAFWVNLLNRLFLNLSKMESADEKLLFISPH